MQYPLSQDALMQGFWMGIAASFSAINGAQEREACSSNCNSIEQIVFSKKAPPIAVSSITEYKSCIEQLLSEIDEYYDLPEGWDNELEEKTNPTCLSLAKKFVCLLQPVHKIPEFSAATGEEVALYWQEENFYFIIHFFQNNSLRYFCKTSNSQISGEILSFSDSIPQEIELHILKRQS